MPMFAAVVMLLAFLQSSLVPGVRTWSTQATTAVVAIVLL